jgi:hypothetical protein
MPTLAEWIQSETGYYRSFARTERRRIARCERYAREGTCLRLRPAPTVGSAAWRRAERLVLRRAAQATPTVAPSTVDVFICGGSPKCRCQCPDGPCEHVWDGPEARGDSDGGGHWSSATCSRCNAVAMDHDLWVLP